MPQPDSDCTSAWQAHVPEGSWTGSQADGFLLGCSSPTERLIPAMHHMLSWRVQGRELESKQLNGVQETNGAVVDSSAAQVEAVKHNGQPVADREQNPSHAPVVPLTEEALSQRNPFENAAAANGDISAAEAKHAGAQDALEPVHLPADAADSTSRQEMQQKAEEKSGAKAVPRLKIPLSPTPASARELPSSRAGQPDSSARSRGHRSEQLPDEGWSPRQVCYNFS